MTDQAVDGDVQLRRGGGGALANQAAVPSGRPFTDDR